MRIALLPGDGIGPEVVGAARRVLDALVPDAELSEHAIGYGAYQQCGVALPEETLQAVRESDAALLGAVTTPIGIPGYRSPVLELRQQLKMNANLRPVRSSPLPDSRQGVDLLIVRENSEGLYVGRESLSSEGETAIAERVVTRSASERIARQAFEIAQQRRGRVTVAHKANVLRKTCGLFLEAAQRVSSSFPDVLLDDMLVDACMMRLIRQPEDFDVVLTTNLFGDILSDGAAELVGGLGLARSANLGPQSAVFEPVHGSAPDIAGRGIASPFATLGALSMLLDHLGHGTQAKVLETGMSHLLREGLVTRDLGGNRTTQEVVNDLLTLVPG